MRTKYRHVVINKCLARYFKERTLHFTKKATDILFLPHISSSPGRKIGSWIPDHGTEDKCKNHVHELQKKKKKKWEIMILVFLPNSEVAQKSLASFGVKNNYYDEITRLR